MQPIETLVSVIDNLPTWGDRVAVRLITNQKNIPLTYPELHRSACALAKGLRIKKGETVGLFAPNSLEWFVAAMAILKAGGIIVPIDMQSDSKSLEHILSDSGINRIFTTEALQDKVATVPTITLLDKSNLLNLEHTQGDLPQVNPEDLAVLFYTSGTTGRPKGVPLAHGKMAFSLRALLADEIVKPDDIVLLPLPLHHVYPIIMGFLYPLCKGLEIILPEELTGPAIARAITTGNVSAVIGVPRLYSAMVSGIQARAKAGGAIKNLLFKSLLAISTFARKRFGLKLGKTLLAPLHRTMGTRLRILASGGSKLDSELGWTLEGMGWDVAIGYGLTETAPLLSFTHPGDGAVETVGMPIEGVTIRIAKGADGTGEILAKGPNVFSGYLNLPDKTKEVFTEDGWFRTGDLGYIDDSGRMRVLGRASTLIVASGGEKIQPEDVEAVYQQNHFIQEMAIFQQNGRLVALVVPNVEAIRKEGGDVDWNIRQALTSQSRTLASYQRVTDFVMTREPLPRTRLGKLRRHLLPDLHNRAKNGSMLVGTPITVDSMPPEDRALVTKPAPKSVWEWLCSLHPNKHLTLDSSVQLDLGVDSLEWINYTLEIRHRAGVELGQEAFGQIESIRDLLNAVAASEAITDEEVQVLPFDNPENFLTEEQKHWLTPLGFAAKPLLHMLHFFNKMLLKVFFRLKVKGLENVPKKGPYIICPNHVSHLDPFAIAAAIDYSQLSTLRWGGWQGVVMRNPLNRAISRLSQAVPIDPQNAALSSLAVGAAILKQNHNLVWFPEGRRSPEGTLQTFKPGIGMLLEHYDVPVIPVYIEGTYEALPMGQKIPGLREVTVTFGTPLTPEELLKKGSGKLPHERITNGLYHAIKTLGEAVEK
ncbi:MAG: AMP-binding protein [Chlamydiales bacterium]|nr:AMP-binding protein [Chlamydiales bacterium]